MTLRLLSIGVFGFASGIILCSLFVLSWPVVAFVFLLAGISGGAYAVYKVRTYAYLCTLLLCVMLGMVRVLCVPMEVPAPFVPLVDTPVQLSGTIVRDPDIRETAQRVTVRVEREGVLTNVLVVAPLYPRLSYADRVQIAGTLTYPKAFETDGGRSFDYPHFLAKDGVFVLIQRAQVTIQATELSVLERVPRALFAIRRAFARGVSHALPEPESSLAVGLIAGGKQGLGNELLEAFTVSGLLPIVVLSGYNVMIVAEAVLRSLRFLPRVGATGVAGIVILLFVLASGAGASAVRAGVMAGVGLFARATGRTYDALRALVFVFVLMLAHNPLLLLYDPGFQFSVIATLGLIVGSPLVSKRLTWVKSGVLREVLATTISAQLFVLPLLLFETGNLSFIAVPANILVLPVVPFAMLLSFVAGVVGLLVPFAAPIVGLPAYALLHYIVSVARVAAELPLAHTIIPAFPFVVVLLLYGLLGAGVWWLKRNTARP